MTVVGVALEGATIRAVARQRGAFRVVEFAWDPLRPETAVDRLRNEFGSARVIALSIGLAFLEIAQPALPPVSDADRQRVLMRDADRYFPLTGGVAVAVADSNGLSFGVESQQLAKWIRAFSDWSVVVSVVPAPLAIAHALRALSPNTASAFHEIDAGEAEHGTLRIARHQVVEARRIPRLSPEAHEVRSMPAIKPLDSAQLGGVAGRFAAAIGALQSDTLPSHAQLRDATLSRESAQRRRKREWQSYAGLAAALLFLGWSVDNRRGRQLDAARLALSALEQQATKGVEAQHRLAAISDEVRALSSRTSASPDPLTVLASLSRALPADAFVDRIEWNGAEWHIEGSTNQSSRVIPALESTPIFSNARILTASTRYRDGTKMRESFSVSFRSRKAASVGSR